MIKVNPRQARRFAEVIGKLAKTDRCDAAMLARMGAALELQPRPIVSETLDKMKEFLTARDALVKDRTAALTRRHTVRSPLLRAQLAARLRQIDNQITAIEKKLKELRRADPDVQERYEILISIPGVGDVTAYVLIVDMSELGGLDPGQAGGPGGRCAVRRRQWEIRGPEIDPRRPREGPRSSLYGGSQRHDASTPNTASSTTP